MNIFGLGVFAAGYAFTYWALNILVQSYKRTTTMNPPPLSVCFGIPGSDADNPAMTANGNLAPAPAPGPDVPGTTASAQQTPPQLGDNFDPLTTGP